MANRRLDLRINELAVKSRWLMTLSDFLSEARVLGSGRWDVRRMCYEVDFERIAYESRLVVGDAHEYPTIACTLAVAPVLACVDGRDALEESWEGETVQVVELRDRFELALVTSYGVTRLQLGPGASLEIRDVGPRRTGHTVCDYGQPAVDLQRASELMRLRVV